VPNPYFNNTINLIPGQTARAGDVEDDFDAVTTGFDLVKVDMDLKSPIASPTFNGIPQVPNPDGATPGQIVNVYYMGLQIAALTTLGDLLDLTINTSGTCAVNIREKVDTTGGVLTRTLPASAANNAVIAFKDWQANFHINKLVVQPATGHRIETGAINEAMDVTERYAYFALKWDSVNLTWRVL